MPDRFANDDPAKAPGLYDRTKPRHYHSGDWRGVIQRLPYLKDLGITAVWLTPWYDNHDRLNDREKYIADNKLEPVKGAPITDYHGYGATDLYAVDEHLGDLATLRELVEAAPALGLKVIQDQVAIPTTAATSPVAGARIQKKPSPLRDARRRSRTGGSTCASLASCGRNSRGGAAAGCCLSP